MSDTMPHRKDKKKKRKEKKTPLTFNVIKHLDWKKK